jgi:hypothetical protein
MVIVKLIGGLGNQMFQYAIGRNLSIKNKTSLYLDLSQLLDRNETLNYTFRDFELNVFDTHFCIVKNSSLWKAYRKIYNSIFPSQYITESNHFYNSSVLDLTGNIYLDGYWQNEKYFKGIDTTIRKDFTFKNKPNEINRQYIDRIKSTNAVSIHFRRGDYITNSEARSYQGICTEEYYLNAIKHINQTVRSPHFFIFSDDIDWVKQNFPLRNNYSLIDFNKGRYSFEDMRLMSLCKHNIIANSSFSWWGAWLNANKNKIIISPTQWFTLAKTEIVPPEWIKM